MTSRDSLGPLDGQAMPPPDAVVRYAAHDDGLVDVHLPVSRTSSPVPLLVLLHGGFWRHRHDRRHTRTTAAALAAEGFVVATPEYRRIGNGGGWPTTVDDVAAAVTAAPRLLAGLGIPTTGMTVLGHSAGGHLALWLANQQHRLDRVVGLAPVGDLRAAARDRLGGGAVQELLGGEPEEVPGRYDAADPAVRLRTRPGCEVFVVHGDRDEEVPLAHSRGLAEAHPFVDLRVAGGAGHFDVMDPASRAWPVVLQALC